MKRFHKQRLVRLADKLEGVGPYAEVGPVPTRKFDMLFLFAYARGDNETRAHHFDPLKCTTAACACGWAISDSWFNAKGLEGEDLDEFFGVGDKEFESLFEARSYRAGRFTFPKTVAKRIRKFVEGQYG